MMEALRSGQRALFAQLAGRDVMAGTSDRL
jgi:hypothetical protein